MNEFNRLLELTDSEVVELGSSFKDLLHKELVLGQTRYVCRFGSLSDGHEKITPAQRYYQAIKEMYYLCSNIRTQKALAMEAQAELLDAVAEHDKLKQDNGTTSQLLRSDAKILRAKEKLMSALVTVEDQMRMVDEYNRIRLELRDQVRSQYPAGIEQAEYDNWKAVFEYRVKSGVPQRFDNVPLDATTKAELGLKYNIPQAMAPLEIQEKDAINALAGGDLKNYIAFGKGYVAMLEQKQKEKDQGIKDPA